MTLTVDYSGEYAYIDGVETVTYTPLDGSAVPTAKALRGDLSFREIVGGGPVGIISTDIVFTLWHSTIGSNTPRHGDTITDSDGVVYAILSTVATKSKTQWRCVCRQNK